MRLLIFGNSGSGKTTLARRLADKHRLPLLCLDAAVWEPDAIAVRRPESAVRADLAAFAGAHPDWIMEGCYGGLVEMALPACSLLVFLNPGLETCLANCRSRPWEPDKYPTRAEQGARLPMLLEWVTDYYARNDDLSLSWHRRVFAGFPGPKHELTTARAIAEFSPA